MNIIKKYWDSVYIYAMLLVPGLCMCAGSYWTACKLIGLYENLRWAQIMLFDFTQLVYLAVALFYIYQNKKDSFYIAEHLLYVKSFIVLSLFIQYNFIMYLFPSYYLWECTFIFFICIVFFFDSKLMLFNILLYALDLVVIHIFRAELFLPVEDADCGEVIAYRILIFTVTSFSILFIVSVVERFLAQAQESSDENTQLAEKQLKYYKDMELLDIEIRKFRHDIQNHFICMEYLFENGKTEELQEYFKDLQVEFSHQKKMFLSGNEIVDAILHYDLPHYCREEVEVMVYGNLPEIKTISAMDMCTLFSNLLSNAIASANRCAESSKSQLIIRFAKGNKFFSIEMANSILKQDDGKKKNKKDRNHGHGIYKIKGVVEKYGGSYEQKEEEQIMTITVYLPI